MSSKPTKRSDPGWSRGQDSRNNRPTLSSNKCSMSILPIDPALARCRWEDEDRRLEKLFEDTGREIHRLALERHREGVREKTGRLCE